jgi:hypothetical protein
MVAFIVGTAFVGMAGGVVWSMLHTPETPVREQNV